MADKIRFYPLDIDYEVEEERANIRLFGTTTDSQQICIIDDSFKPYFYVFLKKDELIENFREKLSRIKIEDRSNTAEVTGSETASKNYMGKKRTAVKVFTKLPSDIPLIRDVIKEWDMVESIREYDIPFVKRYLIDKDIAMLTLTEVEGEPKTKKMKIPCFKANKISQIITEFLKSPKALAFDIETYSPAGKGFFADEHPILMIAFYGDNDYKKVITWKKFKHDESQNYIEFVDGEIELIQRFKEVIEHYKPDILTGYFSDGFDFPYIITRARKYKIKLDLNLDYSEIEFRKGRTENIQLRGIVHLDIFKFISKIINRSLETDSLSLDAVASELLGEKKHDVNIEELTSTWDNQVEEKLAEFCKYNLHDAMLTYKLFTKLFPNISELDRIVGIPLYEISRHGFSHLVEWYIIKNIQKFNEIAPNKPSSNEISERMMHRYEGAFVYQPSPGLYNEIIIFDFRSLYPTIISSHNICPSTLNCDCCSYEAEYAPTEKKQYWFCKRVRGFLPAIIEDLIMRRMRIKEMLKEKKDAMLSARSESLKLLANAFYGYMGFYAARWYCFECARSVTAYGRYYINRVIDLAKQDGFEVIYSDTDSIFLLLGEKTEKHARDFVEKINLKLPKLMELEYEGLYPAGIFVSAKAGEYGAKKKYALLTKKGEIKIKGFETVRRNWSFIAKEAQKEILSIILKENSPEKALAYAKKIIADLRNKTIPNQKVVIHTQLQKPTSDYASVGPHVAVARRMKEKGMDVAPGSMIRFIVTSAKGIIRDKAKLPEEVSQGDYDADYYINNQVVPAVDRILAVFGFEKEDILHEKKQNKLDSYFG